MEKKVYQIDNVSLSIIKTNPKLSVNATGTVNSGGWNKGKLIPYIYKTKPTDGIYEFDFYANAPDGPAPDMMQKIKAETFEWPDYPAEMKGIRVYASSNFITEYFAEKRVRPELLTEVMYLEKIERDELQKLIDNNDSYSITNVSLWEHVLHISVRYGGGCEKHDFRLLWDGSYQKSNPPQATIHLVHNNNGDACRAIVHEDLQFDLSVIGNGVIIHLEGWANPIELK